MAVENESVFPVPAVWQPESLAKAWRLKQALTGEAVYSAGSTYLRTQWESGAVPLPGNLIDLRNIPELQGINISGNVLIVGALTPLSECRAHPGLASHFPALTEAVRLIAAPSIRNLATIGGNIVSGLGDALPALLAYNAELVWFNGKRLQSGTLFSWLSRLRGQGSLDFRILKEIRIPIPSEIGEEAEDRPKRIHVYHKIGRRESFTPSLVTVAMTGHLFPDGRMCGFRLAAGGSVVIPARLTDTESLLNDKVYEPSLLSMVYESVVQQFEAYDDVWSSAEYRKRTAANLIVAELWKAMALWGKGDD